MASYIIRRVLFMLPVLFGLSLLTFTISHLIPGDPVMLVAGPQATKAEIAALAKEYGVDEPLPTQYALYLSGLLRGDFGRSIRMRIPVTTAIFEQLLATLELTLAALGVAVVVGVGLGLVAAVRRGTWLDTLSMVLSLVGVSMPIFWS